MPCRGHDGPKGDGSSYCPRFHPRLGDRGEGSGEDDEYRDAVPVSADSPFLRACRGEPADRVPVWFMRQAGRSLPEYRALRAGSAMLDACRDPDLITEITLQPVRRHGVDAAIFFSDIMVPLAAIGVGVEFVAGVGPVVEKPIRSTTDLDVVRPLTAEDVPYISTAVRRLVAELGDQKRVLTPQAALDAGASWLVVGRPITGANDPVAAARTLFD